MKRFIRTFLPILMLGTLAAPFILIQSASASAVSGDGTMVVSPTSTSAGSTGNVLSFTFTANQGGGTSCSGNNCAFNSGSYLTLVIPAGWTAPNTTSGTHGYTTVTGCTSSSIGSISGTGPWSITVNMTCSANATLTITYGAGSGGSVTAPTAPGTLTFTTSTHQGSGGTATAITTSPTVTVFGPAAQLVFTTQPGAGIVNNPLNPQPVVTVEDAQGNVVTSDSETITLAIDNNAGPGGTLSGCSATTTNGVASFSGCQIDMIGQGYTLEASNSAPDNLTSSASSAFNITGPAAQLVFSTSPVAGLGGSATAFTTQPVVKVEDLEGNVVTSFSGSITLAPSGGTLSSCSGLTAVSGVVTVSNCTFNGTSGTSYSLTASSSGLTSGTSASFVPTYSSGTTASKLVFTTSPVAGSSGSIFAVQPVVKVESRTNGVVTGESGSITLTATSGGTLSSCSGLTASSGVVNVSSCTFAGLIGTQYTLTASYTGLTSATSASFSPTGAGPAAQLVFTTQPGAGIVNNPLNPQPVVTVEDAQGNVVTSDSETITLAIDNNAGPGGTLSGCSATTTNGVASFSGCQIDMIGQGYTLEASNSAPDNLTSSASSAFNITGPAAQLVFSTSPVAGLGGSATAFTTQPVVKVEDLEGNVVTSFSGSITLAPSGGTLSSCSGLTAVSGVVTVSNCTFNGTSGTSYSLTASSSGLTSGTSASFVPTYSSGTTASKLVFTTSPVAGSSGSIFAVQPVVKVESRTNGVVTGESGSITLTATSGGTLSSCSGLTASSGVVNVSSCTFAGLIGTQYTLTASYTGLTSATSASFSPTGAGPAAQLVFTPEPPATGTAGTPLTSFVVSVEDAQGNVVTTGTAASDTITLSIASGPAGGVFNSAATTYTNVAAVNGQATFSAIVLDTAGTNYSFKATDTKAPDTGFAPVTSTPDTTIGPTGTVTQFALTGLATMAAGATNNLTIVAEDTYGNKVTTYSGSQNLIFSGASTAPNGTQPSVTNSSGAAISFGSTTAINFTSGQATVSGSSNGVMSLYKAETANIVVTQGSISNSSDPLQVIVSSTGTATQFSLTAATTTPTAGAADNLTITAEDTYGNTVTTYTGSKSLTFSGASAIGSNNPTVTNASASATNFGTAESITFASGVASPTTTGASGQAEMTLYQTGTDSIVVSAGSINNGSGLSVTVGTPGASQLVFGQQPSNAYLGLSMSPAVTVLIEDQYGNLISSNSSIALTVTTNPCGGSPVVTNGTVSAVSGTATFSSLQISKECIGYALTATDGHDGNLTVPSTTFTVSAIVTSSANVLQDAATDTGGSGMNSVTYYYCSGFTTSCSSRHVDDDRVAVHFTALPGQLDVPARQRSLQHCRRRHRQRDELHHEYAADPGDSRWYRANWRGNQCADLRQHALGHHHLDQLQRFHLGDGGQCDHPLERPGTHRWRLPDKRLHGQQHRQQQP